MSQINTDENILSETEAEQEETNNNLKFVPVRNDQGIKQH